MSGGKINVMEPKIKKPRRYMPNGEQWNQASWASVRQRAMASKEPYCAICHGFIDMTAPPMSPNGCEIDHIVPISRGGQPYELDNLQLTHMKCNRRKGAKMASDYPSMAVENPVPLSNNW